MSIARFERQTTRRRGPDSVERSELSTKPAEDDKWRRLIFNVSASEEIIANHLKLVIEGLNYAVNNLKPPSFAYIESRQITLEKKRKKFSKTLILDLDETLITSCLQENRPDMILAPDGEPNMRIMIKVRPFAQQFLNIMKDHFEIIIFTASTEVYAKTVVNALDPKMECISYLFHREFCLETNRGIRIKDLRIFKNRDLKDMIIVDNYIPAFSFQLENGIPILEWRGDQQDKELMYLVDYLLQVKEYDDVRECNRKKLGLLDLAKEIIQIDVAP